MIHELGHFLAAKWMGVRVEKFSIGFPPTIYSKKIGETEFSIAAIPLGGYVKMSGFIDESMDSNITGADYEFNSKPIWKRVIIILGGVIMNLLLAILVMSVLTYSQGERIIPVTTVGYIGEKGVAQQIGFEKGDRILAINGQPVNTWNDVQQVFLDNLNHRIEFSVIRGGKTMTLIYRKEWFKEKKGEQLDVGPLFEARVGDVTPSMPAGKVGLQRGDQILEIAGEPVHDWMEMTRVIRAHPQEEVSIKWRRGDQILSGKITPQKFEEKDENGKMQAVGKIGVGYYYDLQEVGLLTSLQDGVVKTFDLINLNTKSIAWIITGTKSASEIIGGPIMIAKMAGDAAQAGWQYLWYLIAALSAVLAFFNVLPIPGLDGGHLFFILLEGVMGRPLPIKMRLKIQQVGVAILLTLLVFIVYIDLKRLLF
jgi:regulator of sigma E protease